MPWQVEERVDLGDRHLLRASSDADDVVTRSDLALLDHPEVEAGPAVGHEQGRHARLPHAYPDAEAGHAGLRHLEDRTSDPVPIADAYLVVGEPLDREVLSELSGVQWTAAQLSFPVPIRLDLVDEHRPVLAAVRQEVSLGVPVHVEASHQTAPGDGSLPDGGMDRTPLPRDIARQTDIHG